MKRNKFISIVLIVTLLILYLQLIVLADENWNAGAKINFTPASYDKQYEVPNWMCGDLDDLGIQAYENLYDNNYKWNVFVGPLRVYQNYLKTNGMQGLTANGASIAEFVDYSSLEPSTAKSEAEILVRLEVLSGVEEEDGKYMYMQNYVKRSEVAKILAVFYQKLFPELQAVRGTNNFEDVNDHWSKPYVDYCYERGLLDGKSETSFDPEGFVTKAESIRLLCNMVNGENALLTQNVAKAINETYMCTTAYDEENKNNNNYQYQNNSSITPDKWYYSVFPNSTVNVEVKSGSSYRTLNFRALNNNIKIAKTSSTSGKYVVNVKGIYEGVGFVECKYSNAASDSYETLYIPIFVKGYNADKAKNISVRSTTLQLNIGNQYLLSNDVNVTPSSASYNGIYFSSTNPKVASVNYLTGQVVARGNGTCYIYVMTYNMSKKIEVRVSGYGYDNGNNNNNYNTNYLNLSVKVGKTLNLRNYLYNTGYSLSYYSSNNNIATVSSAGIVTGKRPGRTQINAYSNYTQYIINLLVEDNYNNYYDEVQNISLRYNDIDILVDEDYDLFDNMYIYPEYANTDDIRFTSEDTSIAKVGKKTGNVTGISEGVTRIKIYCDNVTRYCTVYVGKGNSGNIPISDININLMNNALSLDIGQSYSLENNITIYPSNATNKKLYYSSDRESVVTVDSKGQLTGISAGIATITIKAGNIQKYVYITVNNSEVTPPSPGPSPTPSIEKIEFLNKDIVNLSVGMDFNPYSILNVTSGATFTLSDYSKAKVENNRIVGLSEGIVTLTATYNGTSDSIQISVIK